MISETIEYVNRFFEETKMGKEISIMWSDNWINILHIQENYNINNIYERTTKEYISLESHLK